MTPGQPHVYQIDELLDTMPNACRYIEPPSQQRSLRPPRRPQARSNRSPVMNARAYTPSSRPIQRCPPAPAPATSQIPPTDEPRLLDRRFAAIGSAPRADGASFLIGWRYSEAGEMQAEGMVSHMTSASPIGSDLRAALLRWLLEEETG